MTDSISTKAAEKLLQQTRQSIRGLETELAEMRQAERFLQGIVAGNGDSPSGKAERLGHGVPRKLILNTLGTDTGKSVTKIQADVNADVGFVMKETTLRSTLSKLKGEGFVVQGDDGTWRKVKGIDDQVS
jgi:hypothetical protein